MRKSIILLALALAALTSCKGTWLMYDTSQTDHLYFQEASQVHTASFTFVADDSFTVKTKVYLMGQPSSEDRTYDVEFIDSEPGDTLSTGGITYQVEPARFGEDFTLGPLVIPAGAVSADLNVILHRTPRMLEGKLLRVGIRLKDNSSFLALPPDSTRTSAILGPDYYLYVNDGEPACPSWWNDSGVMGWHFNLGKFYPEKYRRFLEYFHATEQSAPYFFNWTSAAYGYYLDDPDPSYYLSDSAEQLSDEQKKSRMMNTFWRKAYATAWASYVFLPLYRYYKEYYEAHPDSPNVEPMGVGKIDRGKSGWADPLDPTWGFLN